MKYKNLLLSITASSCLALLSACGGSSNNSVETPVDPPVDRIYTYEVAVTNLTNAQPLSPIAVVLHDEGKLWTVGEAASVALEKLAEGGDNSEVLAMNVALAGGSGQGIVMPGATEIISVDIDGAFPNFISVATMLVNTNDAFTGVNAKDVSGLNVDESLWLRAGTYDSGTEANSEEDGTLPGPANANGEGYNAERDDVNDIVTMHPGVVTQDDGLMTSVLTQAHRFDNPTIAIKITRTK